MHILRFLYILIRWSITSFIILGFLPVNCKAQDLFELVKEKKSTVVFLGVDFTHTRFVGSNYFNSQRALKDGLIKPLNFLLGAEQKKYDLAGSMHFPESQYSYNANYFIKQNNTVTYEELISDTDTILTSNDLLQVVHDYDLNLNAGMGICFIAENFNKASETGSFWVTFIDLSTKKIILAENIKGKAGGAGLRNYWARSVFNVIKDIEPLVYNRIKKGGYLAEAATFWNNKYKHFVPQKQRMPIDRVDRKNDYTQVEKGSIEASSTTGITDPGRDSMLLESIINDNIDTAVDLEKFRFEAFLIYKKDIKQVKALQATAILSEYLADYELAANLYGEFLKKLNPQADKRKFSKARAHQITCDFLKQSDEKNSKSTGSNTTQGSGYGLTTFVANGHVFVHTVLSNGLAEKAGILPCDEIKMINGASFAEDWITAENIESKLVANAAGFCKITVTRIGSNQPKEIILKNLLAGNLKGNTGKDSSDTQDYADATNLNERQKKKQSFLGRIIAQIQKDTVITKVLANSQKITYALSVLNKWAQSPVDSKIFTQIDEQLGMISSLFEIIKGNGGSFSRYLGELAAFSGPLLNKLNALDYAKEEAGKFDSVAAMQPVEETKIDDNITIVKNQINSNLGNFTGSYNCYSATTPSGGDITVTNNMFSTGNIRVKIKSCIVNQNGKKITIECSFETTVPGGVGYSTIRLSGDLEDKIAQLNGSGTVTIQTGSSNNFDSDGELKLLSDNSLEFRFRVAQQYQAYKFRKDN